jgi:hypothetical protein
MVALCASTFAQPASSKSPPPHYATLTQANRSVREIFKADIAQAQTPAQKLDLAKRLLESASDEKLNTANRYALLLLARDMAVESGDVETASTVANVMLESYLHEPLKFKLEIAQALDKTTRAPHARADLVSFYSNLMIESIQLERFEAGRRISSSAQASARHSGDDGLIRQISATEQRLRDAEIAHNGSKKARLALAKNPADPAASLTVGKYCCFYKSDWKTGLPLLAQSSDASLKSLAARELADPEKPEAQAALADDWWTVAESAPGSTKAVIQSHAAAWYRKSLPALAGLTKVRVQRRLTDVQLGGADDELLPLMTGKLTANDNGIITLKHGDRIESPQTFSPPVVFRIVAQTEDTNIRIHYAQKQIIFNWELNRTELRVDGGRHKAGAGLVPKNTWVTIDLLVRPRSMAISVDGELRHEFAGDFTQINEPLQLFTYISSIKIKSVRVRQLAP